MTDPNFIKKLAYRSKNRGCKETDLLLGRFADEHLAQMSFAELEQYAIILDQTDADIVSWIMGHTEVPNHLRNSVMNKLLQT